MLPFLPRVQGLTLLQIWLAVAVAVFIAKPWGTFGWDEWFALVAPLLLLHPSVRWTHALFAGLVASGLAWGTASNSIGGWLELACVWVVLVLGITVGFIASRGGREEQSSELLAHPLAPADLLAEALSRELCRARRHEGSFAVLSLDQDLENPDMTLHSIHELLNSELHAYADIAVVGDRVLALVPEVKDEQHLFLLSRLAGKAQTTLGGDIRIGVARFPRDAICVEDLIDAADRKRLEKGVFPIHGTSRADAYGQVST